MNTIDTLKEGDVIAIVATARKVSEEEMRPAIETLKSWGLHVKAPVGLYAMCHQLAGDDDHRTAMAQQALDDPEVKAILCARGGYGTVRIVDRLDFTQFAKRPKWIVGYSDVTVLHSHIHRHLGLPTLHATMPINFPPTEEGSCPATESLRRWLFGEGCDIVFDGGDLSRSGEVDGVVVGGNLSMLYSLCGSPSAIDTEGKILLIEDLDEYLYHIDRMMQNLKRNGMLKGLKGLIVGGLTDMHDNTVPFGKTAAQIVAEAVAEYGYPVAFDAPFGHLGKGNLALPLGVEMHFSVDDSKKCRIFAT